jgi:hypothetical protein
MQAGELTLLELRLRGGPRFRTGESVANKLEMQRTCECKEEMDLLCKGENGPYSLCVNARAKWTLRGSKGEMDLLTAVHVRGKWTYCVRGKWTYSLCVK